MLLSCATSNLALHVVKCSYNYSVHSHAFLCIYCAAHRITLNEHALCFDNKHMGDNFLEEHINFKYLLQIVEVVYG
jgi:hypothetical protein